MFTPRTARRVAVLIGREPADRYSLHQGYIDALFDHGANPIVLALGGHDADQRILESLALCDALLLTGGHDVAPERYGESNAGLSIGIDEDRDRLEIAAIEAARRRSMRVLGVCRGAQILNVALGGTLHQDVGTAGFREHMIEDKPHDPVHGLVVEPKTLTSRLLAGQTKVNSLHHQAVKVLAPGAKVGAFADDGLIEAFETEHCLGIQWHPERMLGFNPSFAAAFKWLAWGQS